MTHPYGVGFNDIEILRDCRPDSFKKLEKPMDLETLKCTLENNLYSTVQAFAEDVRTSFCNAMHIFPATDDVHPMATKLSEHFKIGFKIKAGSLNSEPKTCNEEKVSDNKETRGKKTDPPSRKRKSAAGSSGMGIKKLRPPTRIRQKRQSSFRHWNSLREGERWNKSAPEKSLGKLESPVNMSPRRGARIAALMDRFSGTIKKAEKEFPASALTDRDLKRKSAL